jgi:hypothetical protein
MSYTWKKEDVIGNALEFNPDKGDDASLILTIGQQYTIIAFDINTEGICFVQVEDLEGMWFPLERFDMLTEECV